MDLLISIHPVHIEKILSNEKKFEFRTKIFKKEIEKIYIYATVPKKKIVGYFEYEGYLEDSPEKIWEKCGKNSGITKEFFFEYFKGRKIAYAIKIKKFHKIEEVPLPNGIKAPQSYKYVDKFI